MLAALLADAWWQTDGTWWQTGGSAIIWLAAISAALAILTKVPYVKRPVLWLFHRLISEPITGWGKKVVGSVVEERVTKSNGGTSLKDHLDEVTIKQDAIAAVALKAKESWDQSEGRQVEMIEAINKLHACIERKFGDTNSRIEKLTAYSEEVLAEAIGSRERIRQLYRALDVAVFEADAHGHYTYVNPTYNEITGLSAEDSLGEGWVEALHPDDRSRVYKAWQVASLSGIDFNGIYRFRNVQTKEVTEVRGTAKPLHDANGQIVGWVGTLDPTDDPGSTLSVSYHPIEEEEGNA